VNVVQLLTNNTTIKTGVCTPKPIFAPSQSASLQALPTSPNETIEHRRTSVNFSHGDHATTTTTPTPSQSKKALGKRRVRKLQASPLSCWTTKNLFQQQARGVSAKAGVASVGSSKAQDSASTTRDLESDTTLQLQTVRGLYRLIKASKTLGQKNATPGLLSMEQMLAIVSRLIDPKGHGVSSYDLARSLHYCKDCDLFMMASVSKNHQCVIEISDSESEDKFPALGDNGHASEDIFWGSLDDHMSS
jgi:hypothetical protein